MVEHIKQPKEPLKIAIVGKYVELRDAYMSVKEALNHAATAHNRQVDIEWIYSGDLEKDKNWDALEKVNGIVVPGGFGYRGVEGKVMAARYARERKIPYLGLCLGMQVMCIEFARHALNMEDANSTEFEGRTEHHIIDLMPDQKNITNKGGTMRLGLYPCRLDENSEAGKAYDVPEVQERHRHRFEFNNQFRGAFEEAGIRFSGLSPDRRLVEIAEIADHPFMVGCQFHPEFASRPNRPHPLFKRFIEASINYGGKDGHKR
jgi:CTP synthase